MTSICKNDEDLDINNIVNNIIDINNKNNLNTHINYIKFNDKFLNVFYRLSTITYLDFIKLFEKTMSDHILFVEKVLDKRSSKKHINHCQFFYFLELLLIIDGNIKQYNYSSFFKVHNNFVYVDDSTVIDKNTKKIRETIGKEDEPHRGYLLYINLDSSLRNIILKNMHRKCHTLKMIIYDIFNKNYSLFNIGQFLYCLSSMMYSNNNFHGLTLVSSEIYNKSFELSNDDKLILFDDIDNINELWNNIFDEKAKLRIIVMHQYITKFC